MNSRGCGLYLQTFRMNPDLNRRARPNLVVVEILARYLMKEPSDTLVGRF